MNKTLLILTALLLTACSQRLAQLTPPEQIRHDNRIYHLANEQDLGSVARFLYFPRHETAENWQSQIEILLDRHPHLRIADRIALRERVYRQTAVAKFRLTPQTGSQAQSLGGNRAADGLTGYVIYAPSPQHPTWQIDVARGQQRLGCGFVQYQYSQKVPLRKKHNHLSKTQVVKYLEKYAVAKETKRVAAQPLDWSCQK